MSEFYQRTRPGLRDNLGAGLVAAGLGVGVAAVAFYVARLLFAREPLEALEAGEGEDGGGGRQSDVEEEQAAVRFPERAS